MPKDARTGSKGQKLGIGRPMGRGASLGGYCICPNCGKRLLHQLGISCFKIRCPRCGCPMTQELLEYFQCIF